MSGIKTVSLAVLLAGGTCAVAGVASAGPVDHHVIAEATTTSVAAPATGELATGPQAAVGASAVTGPFEVTLLTVEDPVVATDEFLAPEPGNRFVGVELDVRNTSSASESFSSLLSAEIVDDQGQTWSTSLFAVSGRSSIDGDIRSGESCRGWIGFEVPEASTGLRLFVEGDVFGGGEPATFSLDTATTPTATTTSAA